MMFGTFAAVDGGSTGAISDGVVAFVTEDGDACVAVGDGVVLGTTANGGTRPMPTATLMVSAPF